LAQAAWEIGRGGTGSNQYQRANVDRDDISTFSLKAAGISRDLSSRAQLIADVSADEFERLISQGIEAGKLSADRVSRSANVLGDNQASG
jgi:hypothetical protein